MWVAVVNNLPEMILGVFYTGTVVTLTWKARGWWERRKRV